MKTQARRKGIMTALALSCATGGVALAQTARTLPPAAPAGEVRVTDRGPHHRTLSWRVAEPAPGGATRLVERRVVELAAGLHYQGPRGEWLESREVLESYPGGCVSRQGPVKIIFARNLATAGAVDAEAPDGRRLRSHLLGLSYLDRATGQSVLIAEVKDCVGVVDGNVVLYEDAFTALEADVRYSVGRGGYEQDILLRRAPPRPERFGLDPRTTVLQVLTEFLDSPSATLRPEPVTDGAGVTAAGDEVDFGALRLGRGKAFRWDSGTRAGDLPVRKTWRKLGDEGRDFLIEELPLRDIQFELDRLPPTTGAVPGTGDGAAPRTAQVGTGSTPVPDLAFSTVADWENWGRGWNASLPLNEVGTGSTPVRDLGLATTGGQRDWGRGWNASLPTSLPTPPAAPRRVRAQEPDAPGMLLAKVTPPDRAFVLDYQANIGTNDFTFQADTTYVVLGRLDLYGTTTFEGSAVIKATNVYGADLWVHGPMVWDTGLYRPVVFTSKDDDSVGQPLPGSTGNPQRQQHVGLVVAQSGTVRGARFLYARTALCPVTASLTAEDVQFVDCGNAIDAWGQPVTVRNGLFSQVNNLVASHIANLTVTGEHWTGDAFSTLVNVAGAYSLSALKLTNCLFTAGTNWVTGQSNPTIHTSAVTWLASSSGIYRTAAGGRYYLATDSPYRDIGETNLSAPTLTLLRDRTTFAPVTYSNVTFSVNTTFSQQVPRSTATRDLGYHYAALDYALGGCHTAADLNLLVTAGTAIGWFRTNSGWQNAGQGLHLGDRTVLTIEGTATAPAWWVRLTTVQEAERTGGYGPGGLTSWAWPSFADAPTVRARFLRCATLANESLHIRDDWGWLRVEARDCEFYSGGLGGYVSRLDFTNCLFQRVSAWVSHGRTDADLTLRNATFIGGELQINRLLAPYDPPLGQTRVSVRDCAFDRTAISTADVMSGNPLFNDYGWNAYVTNTTQTTPAGANNVLVTNFNWQAGALGNHYLQADSPLVNAGSVSDAAQAGLYHHTTQPNQATEANTRVDVGRHYLAVNGSGLPVDSDGDGLADYLEDANGNGAYDSATDLANWTAADTDNDKVRDDQEISAGTNPKLNTDTDADFLPDDWEIWHLGSLAQTGQGDYDGDGMDNAGEFSEGRNPNTTGFAVSFATTYTRDDPPPGTIAVRAGHPAYWAVLVDTDPTTLAPGQIPWQSCPTGTGAGSSLSIAPSLGNVEGWHTVWVAMRAAPAGAQVTWNRCALKLDRTPPEITLDLAPGTSVPSTLLQIRGQCAEPLRSLSYDLVNASRSLTAAPGFVTAQRTAANPDGCSFQFYDLKLDAGEGGNQITLRFTDLAGNTTMQTFSRTVQAGALTAAITWPPDQTLICGGTFVVTGTVSDPAAAIFATVTAPDGSVATLRGWVDRDQKFYIPDVPLSGTQATISVVASTETAVSSPALVSVVRAAYSLHEVVAGDLRRLEVFTSACIQKSESSLPNIATAIVNGRSVTVVQGGVPGCEQSWEECVPMDLGSAFFLLRVVLTPASGLPVEWLGLYDKPITARLDQFKEGWSWDYWGLTDETHASYGSGDWRDNAPSTAHAWYSVPDYSCATEYSFPADRFLHDEPWAVDSASGTLRSGPLACAGTIASLLTTPCSKGFAYENTSNGVPALIRPLYIPNLWGALREIDLAWRWENPFLVETYSHHAGAQLVVQTGGIPGEQVPARLDLELFKSPAGMAWWAELATSSLSGANVAQRQSVNPGGIQLGANGATDAQGRLYAMLPPNATVCVTPFEWEVRDRVKDVDPASGGSFVWADFQTAPSLAFNITMDTDQGGAPVPGGLDDRLRTTGGGCLVPVNDDDADHDGVPGFADGFNRDGVTDPDPVPPANTLSTDDTSTGDTFSTVVVTVAKGADPVTATLTFRYDAAPPSDVTAAGNPPLWSPGSTGHLRLWNRDGGIVGQRNAASVVEGGDYLPPEVPIPLAQLGFTAAALQTDAQLVSLSVEGINPSEHLGDQWLQFDFDPDGSGPAAALFQKVRVTVLRVDLDIDSDNNNGFDPPARTLVEDGIEALPNKPGKVLWVNNADSDADGIPDFADGYNRDGIPANADDLVARADGTTNDLTRFVPIVMELPAWVPVNLARVRLSYGSGSGNQIDNVASDPAQVSVSGNPPQYDPAPGTLRLWRKGAVEARNSASALATTPSARGDYLPPGDYTDLTALGFTAAERKVTNYVEAVRASIQLADLRIRLEVDPDGPGPASCLGDDAVRVTSVQPELNSMDRFLAGSYSDECVEMFGGWSHVGLQLRNTSTGESYSFARLADAYIYDNPYALVPDGEDSFLSANEVASGALGLYAADPRLHQEVVFYRKDGRLHFRALFDTPGPIEIVLLVDGLATAAFPWTLVEDPDIGGLINSVDGILSEYPPLPPALPTILASPLPLTGPQPPGGTVGGLHSRPLTLKVMIPVWDNAKSLFQRGIRKAGEVVARTLTVLACGGKGFCEGAWFGVKDDLSSIVELGKMVLNPVETAKTFYEGFKVLMSLDLEGWKNVGKTLVKSFLETGQAGVDDWTEPSALNVAAYLTGFTCGYITEQVVVTYATAGILKAGNIGAKIGEFIRKAAQGIVAPLADAANLAQKQAMKFKNSIFRRFSRDVLSEDDVGKLKKLVHELYLGGGCPTN